jgi:hypothetical protein
MPVRSHTLFPIRVRCIWFYQTSKLHFRQFILRVLWRKDADGCCWWPTALSISCTRRTQHCQLALLVRVTFTRGPSISWNCIEFIILRLRSLFRVGSEIISASFRAVLSSVDWNTLQLAISGGTVLTDVKRIHYFGINNESGQVRGANPWCVQNSSKSFMLLRPKAVFRGIFGPRNVCYSINDLLLFCTHQGFAPLACPDSLIITK